MDVVQAVMFAIQEMAMEPLDDSTVGYGAKVDSVLWSPDIPSDTPRYVVDFTVTVMAKQTAA
ncbi:hypothetical protein [Fodinicola feengrottensis]|uniref:hypothetical protein n=1 Tax=Fodinicola feengrottensis TaxID=435914 RepID=UPI0013D16930|nr:hypothetical protein [Fodinicola feengrottensis]